MNVLLVWPNFERTNAAGVRGRAFARGLVREGVEVLVAAPPDHDELAKDAEGWSVAPLALWRDPRDPIVEGWRELRKLGAGFAPDLVVASSPSVLTLLQASSALQGRAPFVADIRDLGAESLAATFGPKPRYRALRLAEARAMRRADAVLLVSGVQRDTVLARYGVAAERAHVVPNGADLDAFRGLSGTPKDVDVLFSGAMDDPGRRGDEVVDAFARVLAQRPQTTFRFLGWRAGTHAAALEERMRKAGVLRAVDLKPPVPHAAVPAELAKARIGIVPLKDDPVFLAAVGAKTYEYLAAGLPVAALGPRGDAELRRLLVGEECGAYAEDVEGFARAILDLLSEEAGWKRRSLRATAVAERFDRGAIVKDAWRRILRPLAEAGR